MKNSYPKISLKLNPRNNLIRFRIRSTALGIDTERNTHIICDPKYFLGKDWRNSISPKHPNFQIITEQLNKLFGNIQKNIDDCRERGIGVSEAMLEMNDMNNFLEYYDLFLKSPQKMEENDGAGLNTTTLKKYYTVRTELIIFLKEVRGLEPEEFNFKNLTDSLLDDLIKWYLNREVSNTTGTIKRKLSKLKQVEEDYIKKVKRDRIQVITSQRINLKGSNKNLKPDHEKVLKSFEINDIYKLDLPQSKNKYQQNKHEFFRDLFIFLCDTGIRISCLCTLEFKHISKKRGDNGKVITVITKDAKKKSGGIYTVALSDRAIEIYLKYKNDPEYYDYVFPLLYFKKVLQKRRFQGEKIVLDDQIDSVAASMRKIMKKVVKKLDVPITFSIGTHTGRYSFITSCIHDSKISLPVIMKYTGHRKVDTLMKYVHIFDDSIHFDLVDKINERNK